MLLQSRLSILALFADNLEVCIKTPMLLRSGLWRLCPPGAWLSTTDFLYIDSLPTLKAQDATSTLHHLNLIGCMPTNVMAADNDEVRFPIFMVSCELIRLMLRFNSWCM